MTNTNGYTVTNFKMQTATGRRVRTATSVECPDGTTINFMEKLGKRDAIRQAELVRAGENWAVTATKL
jgi:hypothetical protein